MDNVKRIEDDPAVNAIAEDIVRRCVAVQLNPQQTIEACFSAMLSVACMARMPKDVFVGWVQRSIEASWVNFCHSCRGTGTNAIVGVQCAICLGTGVAS